MLQESHSFNHITQPIAATMKEIHNTKQDVDDIDVDDDNGIQF